MTLINHRIYFQTTLLFSSLIRIQSFNKKLIDFERLLISIDQLPGMNSPEKIYK